MERVDSPTIFLDQSRIDAIAASYPEEMREPFIWLATYLREECHKDLDILTESLRKLGFEHDKTTWSKIVRGRWNKDKSGNVIDTPVLSVPKFLKAVEALRKDAQFHSDRGRVPFVMTSVAKSIWHYIDAKRATDRVNKFGVVVGHTGSQKTATFREYRRANNHGTVVLVEAPATPTMGQFLSDLGECYGISRRETSTMRITRILECVNERRSIIIDNVQRLHDPRRDDTQPVFSFLQKLQDDTGCTVIISITPVFLRTLTEGFSRGFFEQFEGRAGGRRNFCKLPEYAPEEDVLAIARAFNLRDAEKHLEYLVKISREAGRIRILFEALQEGARAAAAAKRPFVIADIREARGED